MPDGRYRQTVRLGTGLTVPYVAQGDRFGVPVVLLHARGESLGSFDRLLPLLPATIHAIAMDQRGHGAADKPADGYTLVDLADDVVAFLDAVGLTSAVLLGSSSGGYSRDRWRSAPRIGSTAWSWWDRRAVFGAARP